MSAPRFEPAILLDRWQEATDLVGLRVEVPEGIAASYHVPGQYVQLRLWQQEPAYLAIASAPGEQRLSLIHI